MGYPLLVPGYAMNADMTGADEHIGSVTHIG